MGNLNPKFIVPENQTPSQQTTDNNWLVWAFGIVFIILLIAAAVLIYLSLFGLPKKSARSQTSSSASATAQALDAKQATATLLQAAPQPFPKIISEAASGSSSLPSLALELVASDAANLQIQTVVFDNQKTGYELTYVVPRQLSLFHSQYNAPTGWTTTWSAVSGDAGVIDLTSSTLSAQYQTTALGDQSTYVIVPIINK